MSFGRSVRGLIGVGVALSLTITACSSAPALPTDRSPSAAHDLLTGPDGQDFLESVSTYAWDDRGAAASELVDWVAPDAASPDERTAARAGETAAALAGFLADRNPSLQAIETGFFGSDVTTVGKLNPRLTQAFATALGPFQGAMVCDPRGVTGFPLLETPCEAAVLKARPIFAALSTDPSAYEFFANEAHERVDGYLRTYAENDPTDVANPLPSALSYAGRLLGLVTAGARTAPNSPVKPPNIDDEMLQARYVMVRAMLARNPALSFPGDYIRNGELMAPGAVRDAFGATGSEDYSQALASFLRANGNVENQITHDMLGQYEFAAGAATK